MFRRKKSGLDKVSTPSLTAVSEPTLDDAVLAPRSPTRNGATLAAKPNLPPVRTEVPPRRVIDIPGNRRAAAGAPDSECKKLIVGREITLSGNISACERLIVEGTVEANVSDGVYLEIADSGVFRGTAEVDEADIAGRFEGGLTVRKKLTLRATGRVEGTLRYAKLVVEAGAELVGGVELLPDGPVARLAGPAADSSTS